VGAYGGHCADLCLRLPVVRRDGPGAARRRFGANSRARQRGKQRRSHRLGRESRRHDPRRASQEPARRSGMSSPPTSSLAKSRRTQGPLRDLNREAPHQAPRRGHLARRWARRARRSEAPVPARARGREALTDRGPRIALVPCRARENGGAGKALPAIALGVADHDARRAGVVRSERASSLAPDRDADDARTGCIHRGNAEQL